MTWSYQTWKKKVLGYCQRNGKCLVQSILQSRLHFFIFREGVFVEPFFRHSKAHFQSIIQVKQIRILPKGLFTLPGHFGLIREDQFDSSFNYAHHLPAGIWKIGRKVQFWWGSWKLSIFTFCHKYHPHLESRRFSMVKELNADKYIWYWLENAFPFQVVPNWWLKSSTC